MDATPWREMHFYGGVQTWINPRLSRQQPTLEQQQWAMRRADARLGDCQRELEQFKTLAQQSTP